MLDRVRCLALRQPIPIGVHVGHLHGEEGNPLSRPIDPQVPNEAQNTFAIRPLRVLSSFPSTITVSLALLFVPIHAYASETCDEIWQTKATGAIDDGSMFVDCANNGFLWAEIDQQTKILMVVSYQESLFLVDRVFGAASKDEVGGWNRRMQIDGFRTSDIVSVIDGFYGDAANKRAPVFESVLYAIRKMRGDSLASLAAFEVALRSRYNN